MKDLVALLPALVVAVGITNAARRGRSPRVWLGLMGVWIAIEAVRESRAGIGAGFASLLMATVYLLIRARVDPNSTLFKRR